MSRNRVKSWDNEQAFTVQASRRQCKFQKDDIRIKGDVRDIVIKWKNLNWETGLSIKHNRYAVKHSRLSHKIDFESEWFKNPCSDDYWNAVIPIFDRLKVLKSEKMRWSELENKEESVYIPLPQAFMKEMIKSYRTAQIKIFRAK